MVNGWLQYAHKENAKKNDRGDVEVEWINASSKDFDYQVSSSPEVGWIKLKEVPFSSWLGYSGHLYVLERQGDR